MRPARKQSIKPKGVCILQGNCLEVLPKLGYRCDMALVDPPYGTTSLSWDRPLDKLFEELDSALKPNASIWVFGQLRSIVKLHYILEDLGWRYAQDIVWEKHNGSSFHNDRFRRVHEHVVQFYRQGSQWRDVYKDPQYTLDAKPKAVRRKEGPPHTGKIENSIYVSHDGGPKLMRSVLQVRSCHGQAVHPTQKPLELLEYLINYSCPPEGRVIDPTAGSGSTLVAAARCGRQALGIEIDPGYVELAKLRVENEKRKGK